MQTSPAGAIGFGAKRELTALLVSPNQSLLLEFAGANISSRSFQVLAEIRFYPTTQVIEMRLRQLRPEVVLLDMSSEPTAAAVILKHLVSYHSTIPVIGLGQVDNANILRDSLRQGVSEFLQAPFRDWEQQEAVSRLGRLRTQSGAAGISPGAVLAFANAKPGSGSSTIAMHTALSIRKSTRQRVLLVDFNLSSGSSGPLSFERPQGDLLQALRRAEHLNPEQWREWVSEIDGVDVLVAPDAPYSGSVDLGRMNSVLEFARIRYEWIVADAPIIFCQISLGLISNSDRAILVSTSDLPSLHLARKAVHLLDHVGFPKNRVKVLVNRGHDQGELSLADLENLFPCPICAVFPNDYFLLNRLLTLRRPLDTESPLGKAVGEFAASMVAANSPRVA